MEIQDMNNTNKGWQPSRTQLSEFLRTQPLCVFSSIDATGRPQGATVGFSETTSGDFIIGTSGASRKSANVDSNPQVALTVTDAERRYTVQLEGEARKLTAEEFADYEENHYDQLPFLRRFKDAPGQVHILIRPSHIRFSDCSSHPWTLTEY